MRTLGSPSGNLSFVEIRYLLPTMAAVRPTIRLAGSAALSSAARPPSSLPRVLGSLDHGARRFSTQPIPDDSEAADSATRAAERKAALEAAKARQGSGGGRPGARKDEMAEAAAKVEGGKTGWQKFMSTFVDMVRPVAAAAWPIVMPMLDGPSQRRVAEAANIEDLQKAAEKRAHAMVYGYLAGGADDERALRRSVASYSDVELRHAVLHGVGNADMDLRTTILGHEHPMPYFITSCAGQRMFHADGEVATAKAAKKHGLHMALSQLTTSTFEEVREAHPDGAKTLQLYVWRDRVLLKEVREPWPWP